MQQGFSGLHLLPYFRELVLLASLLVTLESQFNTTPFNGGENTHKTGSPSLLTLDNQVLIMLSGFTKFILGFFLAIAVLIGGGAAIALYFMNRTGISPAKPIYSNDSPSVKAQAPKKTEPGGGKPALTPGTSTQSSPSSTSTPTESPKATPSSKPLPSGAYRGRVSWAEGLSLRSQPNQESEKIGGVGFNQKIIILSESDDKAWQKIRLEGSEQEGWVKAGNTEKVDQ